MGCDKSLIGGSSIGVLFSLWWPIGRYRFNCSLLVCSTGEAALWSRWNVVVFFAASISHWWWFFWYFAWRLYHLHLFYRKNIINSIGQSESFNAFSFSNRDLILGCRASYQHLNLVKEIIGLIRMVSPGGWICADHVVSKVWRLCLRYGRRQCVVRWGYTIYVLVLYHAICNWLQ